MSVLQEGMYVRCPVDDEYDTEPRMFALGQVILIDRTKNQFRVAFHRLKEIPPSFKMPRERMYSLNDPHVSRSRIQQDSEVLYGGTNGVIICQAPQQEQEEPYSYYVRLNQDGINQTQIISEIDLKVQFTRAEVNPAKQLLDYELHNPTWWFHRRVVSQSMNTLKNATFGFETLVGSRVLLLEHQIDTIIRAVGESPCRFMLADEVGLGKTIEACVIMQGLQERYGNLKTLIIVPDSLIHQWQNELSYKFWLDIPIWSSGLYLSHKDSMVLMPLEKVNTSQGLKLLNSSWDLCIVDESHRLLGLPKEYQAIYALSSKVKHLLLLSATPIQQRRSEYLKLLALLMPQRYGEMELAAFNELLEKQAFLRSKVHKMMADLDLYEEDQLAEDYVYDLEEIAERLEDPTFTNLMQKVNIESEDQGLDAVRLCLAYLGEYYQIDRHIIRHRRLELAAKLPQRRLQALDYDPVGAERGFYEAEVYDALIAYLDRFRPQENSRLKGDFIEIFLSAIFSSPQALHSLLKQRRSFLVKMRKRQEKGQPLLQESEALPGVESGRDAFKQRRERLCAGRIPFEGEVEEVDALIHLAQNWQNAVVDELNRLEEIQDDPTQIKGRLAFIVDYLSQETDEAKFVLFTSWQETLELLETFLTAKFGNQSVVSFHSGKNDEALQATVDRFQSEKECRFMLCDELGGEGRNFQMADQLIHVDMPWSPVQLEQRIGRLDRIGRKRDVISVVPYARGTVEEDLLRLWDTGLNIFRESLSGMEIALAEIQNQITESLGENVSYGLSGVLDKIVDYTQTMRALLDEERHFDMARQLDKRLSDKLALLVDQFETDGERNLYDTMMSWSQMTGFFPSQVNSMTQEVIFDHRDFSERAMMKAFFIPPNLDKAHERNRGRRDIRGTFIRQVAYNREDLIFFAPGDPFFEAIVDNAIESLQGRSCAFLFTQCEIDWQGWIYTWSPQIDPVPLLELGEDVENLTLAQGYIPLNQVMTVEALRREDREKTVAEVLQELRGGFDKRIHVHLGKRTRGDGMQMIREMSNLEWFRKRFQPESWREWVKLTYKSSHKKARRELEKMLELKEAEQDFRRRQDGIRASSVFYGREKLNDQDERLIRIYDALLKGLKNTKLQLDSAVYVWLVKKNETHD